MKITLDDFNLKYKIAENVKLLLKKLETGSYNIILMVLQLPKMNGFDAIEHIRKTMNSTIPIIALTDDVTTDDVDKCRAAGVNKYITKPRD